MRYFVVIKILTRKKPGASSSTGSVIVHENEIKYQILPEMKSELFVLAGKYAYMVPMCHQ